MSAKLPETAAYAEMPESSFKYNPLLHTRILFIKFVQGLFSALPEGCYRWSPDDSTTELYVTGEEEIKPEVVQRVPAVSFVRGPIQFYGVGLDDMEDFRFDTGKKTKGVLLPGTMTINACSRLSLESEHIAFVIADHIWLLRGLLMRQGMFDVGRGIQVGSPSKAGSLIAGDAGDEFFCTPISVPYQLTRLSSVTPLGQRVVQSIEQCISVRGPRRVLSEGAPASGHELPFGVKYSFPASFAPEALDTPEPHVSVQPHPLNPAKQVCVRVVRPNSAASNLYRSRAAIPIQPTCVEQSSVPYRATRQDCRKEQE
jgi:hypothetical protein